MRAVQPQPLIFADVDQVVFGIFAEMSGQSQLEAAARQGMQLALSAV